jgi:stage III sporulation protein SpoIIIAA
MDEVRKLLNHLPMEVSRQITDPDRVTEIVLDLGRPLQIRYGKTKTVIEKVIITSRTLASVINRISEFGPDNRSGIDGTLHRISRITNRKGEVVGLTCRIGKPYYGAIDSIKDFLDQGKNILLLGAPGQGKTTKLRDIARYLSTERNKNVVIVDTSNEIAGDGDILHEAVGDARRLQVPFNRNQHEVMIEAVENHAPDVIIIDEISTAQEADAARTIAQRGVQLIATAHGKKIEDLMKNPPLNRLIGGIKTVTISDDEAARRGTSKLISEREVEPTFDIVIEIVNYTDLAIHINIAETVDAILAGGYVRAEERRMDAQGTVINIPGKLTAPIKEKPEKPRGSLRPKANGRLRRNGS